MADIVPFRRKTPSPPQEKKPTPDSLLEGVVTYLAAEDAEVKAELMDGLGATVGDFEATFSLTLRLQNLIRRDEDRIQRYRTTVKGYTDEELSAFIQGATDDKVQQRPYFYYAIVDESGRR